MLTLQSIDRPCLKLLERYLCRWWEHIEVQPVLVGLLLELGFRKLLLLMTEVRTSLGIYSGVIVANHGCL
jgi:hypothetical protein